MVEIVVYITEDYSENKSIWVDASLSKEQMTNIVNDMFPVWYYYDIL